MDLNLRVLLRSKDIMTTAIKPALSILDESFRYVPAAATSVVETWRRYGWRPTTDEDRKRRRRPAAELVVESVGAVTPIRRRH
jgi:hypothetical protein